MKNLIQITLIILLAATSVYAQYQEYNPLKGSTLMAMKGGVFTYEVDFYGEKYDFIVTITENTYEKGLTFSYRMTNANNTSGTVNITDNARKTASAQNNYFSGGEMNLTDMTTVWVSNAVSDELEKQGKSKISTDGGANWIELQRKYFNYDYSIKTKTGTISDIGYMYCESSDGSTKYWIQTGGNPLILKMDLGWSITLKEMSLSN